MALNEEVEKIVKDEDAAAEIVGSLDEFDLWYWVEEDFRQDWLPEKGVDKPKGLIEVLETIYNRNEKEAAEDGEPIPTDAEKDAVVARLAGLVVEWDKWWPDYNKAREFEAWLEARGDNAEIYEYSEYGDPEKSEGLGGLYVDENMPHADEDIVEDLDLLEEGL